MSGYSNGGASLLHKALKSWLPVHLSARADIDEHLHLLRNRAADLALNNPIGAAIINTLTAGTIGNGLRLFPRIKAELVGLTTQQARDWSRRVQEEFDLWAADCDFLRRNTFKELQSISFRSMLYDGDNFVLFKRRVPSKLQPYSLRVQLIEAQRVCNPMFAGIGNQVEMLYKGNRVVNGIEVDNAGAQVAIHVANRLWQEPTTLTRDLTWQRVLWRGRLSGAANVLHICKDSVPGQFRGVPVLASVIQSLKQLSRYSDAELSASIIRSFFSIFFTKQKNNFDLNQLTVDDVDTKDFKIGSPSVTDLPAGVDVKSIDSARQQSTFADFTDAFIKEICAAVELPFEVVLKTFNASYSASRAALLQADETYRIRKTEFVTDFCQPIYEAFLTEAIALGRVKAEGFFDNAQRRRAWLAADWLKEKMPAIDPVKEAQAAIMRIEAGLSTREKEIIQLNGDDWKSITEQLSIENGTINNGTEESNS